MLRRHSLEPWKAAGPEIRSAKGQQVALVFGQFDDLVERRERIIACVNACAGIPTDLLKQGVVRAVCRISELALRSPDALGISEQPDIDLNLVRNALAARESLKTAGQEV